MSLYMVLTSHNNLPKGTRVSAYSGHTYGLVRDPAFQMAIAMPGSPGRFLVVPKERLQWVQHESMFARLSAFFKTFRIHKSSPTAASKAPRTMFQGVHYCTSNV